MGNPFSSARSVVSDAAKNIGEEVETILLMKKLAEFKGMKKQRDIQLATAIARTRDIVHWMGGFFTLMISANAFKTAVLRTGPITISHFPFLAVPTVFAFQLDMAYGTKMERIYNETKTILKKEKHWFNEPMVLPPTMERAYRKLMDTQNAKLKALGREPEKDWAIFDDIVEAEILDHSYPLTRTLAYGHYGVLFGEADEDSPQQKNANNP
mmetsp:Transcript_6539/g.12023  ORF Transcript_6539/g.12023 Transcript_6539/m.12023 type:complete len:211 (+) Transcript_6539:47-679(+)|eukprot:CAMPEP_0197524650 /NCGR_PEP_ID=MMETSP1318-20131121/9260_1 /TAXON_ID=552666 /ORGANISM="Partenskyella glossopodia, Strain RCC365" /LENGTH=210 /DNA_ID=CAMNT_0043077639 /DNA_START=49 /DNA_END=681 /DNA_ORIENTATION=+